MDTLLLDSQRTDPITGTMTRPAFDAAIREQFALAKENETNLSVLLVLIDQFPKDEDEYDQAAIDEAVITTAALLRNHFEPAGASISRWADSAFALVVPDCGSAAAMAMAIEFRHDLQRGQRSWKFGESGREILATTSVGAAVLDASSSHAFRRVEQLMSGCARALQAVRADGGDAIHMYMPDRAA